MGRAKAEISFCMRSAMPFGINTYVNSQNKIKLSHVVFVLINPFRWEIATIILTPSVDNSDQFQMIKGLDPCPNL